MRRLTFTVLLVVAITRHQRTAPGGFSHTFWTLRLNVPLTHRALREVRKKIGERWPEVYSEPCAGC